MILIKVNIFSKTKKSVHFFFANLFDICLNTKQLEPSLYCDLICVDWSQWKKSGLCRYVLRIFCQNWISGSFLKVSGNVESETLSVTFLYFYIKFISLSCTLKDSFTHAWFHNLMYWSFGKYRFTKLCRSSKC